MTKSYFGDNLYTLRKQRGLSQDEFAEKMGVSRQAISKWERNESYPDTENLIAIAKFFGISIDDMINTSLDHGTDDTISNDTVSADVIDIEDKENSKANQTKSKRTAMDIWVNLPYPILITVIYLLWGFLTDDGWAIGWTLFVTIPVYSSIIECIRVKRITPFCYPVFVTFIFLLFGMLYSVWHPLWVIYLTIPIFYSVAPEIDKAKKRDKTDLKKGIALSYARFFC